MKSKWPDLSVCLFVTDRLHTPYAIALGGRVVPDGLLQLCTYIIDRTNKWTHKQTDNTTDISPNLVISGVCLGIFRSQYTDRLNQCISCKSRHLPNYPLVCLPVSRLISHQIRYFLGTFPSQHKDHINQVLTVNLDIY